jgi:hypothetical protein
MSFLKALKEAVDDADVEIALFNSVCEEIDTPRSLACYLCCKYDQWDEYKRFDINDHHYDGNWLLERFFRSAGLAPIVEFKQDRLVSRMLTKSSYIQTGVDPELAAQQTFTEVEKVLELNEGKVPWFPGLQRFIAQLDDMLGFTSSDTSYVSDNFIAYVLANCRFGPGASAGLRSVVASDKLRLTPTVGPNLLPVYKQVMGEIWAGYKTRNGNLIKKVVSYSSVQTVPKTAWTARTISSQPVVDMFFQRGLGVYFEERLRSYGCDIRDQTRNQNLTRHAVRDGLATIDLSSASSWFCEENLSFLRPDLLWLLKLVRQEYYAFPGMEPTFYRNWLPMGAGHTFAFMTLYFLALVRSIVPKRLWSKTAVYGDDIIVPADYAGAVVDALEALRFKCNRDKSFVSGRFYESCGVEVLDDRDVTPFYCRTSSTGSGAAKVASTLYKVRLANRLKHWLGPDWTFGDQFSSVWFALVTGVPPINRNPVPPHLGDSGFNLTLRDLDILPIKRQFSRYLPRPSKVEEGWERVYRTWCWSVKPVVKVVEDNFTILYALSPNHGSAEIYYFRHGALRVDGSSSFLGDGEPVNGLFSNPVLRRTHVYWPLC